MLQLLYKASMPKKKNQFSLILFSHFLVKYLQTPFSRESILNKISPFSDNEHFKISKKSLHNRLLSQACHRNLATTGHEN